MISHDDRNINLTLVDQTYVVDVGPDTPAAAMLVLRLEVKLDRVTTIRR